MYAGILLHGPPGVGKTLLVRQILRLAQDSVPGLTTHLTVCHGADVISGSIGESERRLRQLFEEASAFLTAPTGGGGVPSKRLAVIFLDEVDALCPRRSADVGAKSVSSAASRLVTQLLTLMDGVRRQRVTPSCSSSSGSSSGCGATPASGRGDGSIGEGRGRVVVIGATNRPESIDLALRRPGRFEKEIRVDPPSAEERAHILAAYCARMPVEAAFVAQVDAVAARCVGFVGADFQALCREAGLIALQRSLVGAGTPVADGNGGFVVSANDFEAALRVVTPSALRGLGVATTPTSWDEIGGMSSAVSRLRQAVEFPLRHSTAFRKMGLSLPRGVLLFGPPGNSKTTLVRALTTSIDASFFSLSGADIFSPYVGAAETTIRALFSRARESTPAIIFLDEIDSVVGKRGIGGEANGTCACGSVGCL